MNDRLFLDNNIFVYSFDQLSPSKAEKAHIIISEALETGKRVVSYQVVGILQRRVSTISGTNGP